MHRLAIYISHKVFSIATIATVVVGYVIRVMQHTTDAVKKLLAEEAFMWAVNIIHMWHLTINPCCTMKRWWSARSINILG